MSMFESYDKLGMSTNSQGIQLNNTNYLSIESDTLPRRIMDIKGRFIGYEWNNGDIFDFKIDITDAIKIKNDSIVFNNKGEAPSTGTEGYIGQQAYNTADSKCWTCLGIIHNMYIWVEEDKVYYDKDGTKEIEIGTMGKPLSIVVDFYNFRWELVHSFSSKDSEIVCPIDEEVNAKMPSGIYYATVTINTEDGAYLKNKFTLIVK